MRNEDNITLLIGKSFHETKQMTPVAYKSYSIIRLIVLAGKLGHHALLAKIFSTCHIALAANGQHCQFLVACYFIH